MGGGGASVPFCSALTVEGDDIEADETIRLKIVEPLEDPLVLPFCMRLGFHPALVPGKDTVKISVLDEEQTPGSKAGMKIRQGLCKFLAGEQVWQGALQAEEGAATDCAES